MDSCNISAVDRLKEQRHKASRDFWWGMTNHFAGESLTLFLKAFLETLDLPKLVPVPAQGEQCSSKGPYTFKLPCLTGSESFCVPPSPRD